MDLRIGYLRGELGEIQSSALVKQLSKVLTGVVVSAVDVDPETETERAEGVFASPLEVSLLNCELEAAVASLQDISVLLPEGLKLAAVTQRIDVREAAVTSRGLPLRAMPQGTQVVVNGVRRAQRVPMLRKDLVPVIKTTRPAKLLEALAAGTEQAGIIAMSDLCWMKKDGLAAEILSTEEMLPGAGQGALGIVVREIDALIEKAVLAVNHKPTWTCVAAERELLTALGWNACAPVAVLAELQDGQLAMRVSAVGRGGTEIACAEGTDAPGNYKEFAKRLADDLMRAGGDRIIRESRLNES